MKGFNMQLNFLVIVIMNIFTYQSVVNKINNRIYSGHEKNIDFSFTDNNNL
jgi:hypothetical protein